MQRWVVPLYPRSETDGWCPGGGMLRGILATTAVAMVLSAALSAIAWYKPHLMVDDLMWAGQRTEAWERVFPWGLGASGLFGALVIWILLQTMSRNAGMHGNACTVYCLLMAIAVISSKHVLFAITGLQLSDGFVEGWIWITPEFLLWYSYGSWVGLCLMLCWWHLTD